MMGVYICDSCGKMVDGDYESPAKHPTKPDELLCDNCWLELTDDDGNLIENPTQDNDTVGALGDGE